MQITSQGIKSTFLSKSINLFNFVHDYDHFTNCERQEIKQKNIPPFIYVQC